MTVYVPSRGRAGRAVTVERLLAEGLTPNIVVPSEEFDEYRKAYPAAVVRACPVLGIGPTRNWILEAARSYEQERIWILDDDISRTYRKVLSKFVQTPFVGLMAAVAGYVGQHPEVALAGPMARQFGWNASGVIRNRRVGIMVYLDTTGGWNYWAGVHEDTDLTLQILTSGRETALLSDYAYQSAAMGRNPGGCSEDYAAGAAEKDGVKLVEKWRDIAPGLVSIVLNPRAQIVTKIDWKRFD